MNLAIMPIGSIFQKARGLNLLAAALFLLPSLAFGDTVTVSNYSELRDALAGATNGRVIKLNAGTYAPPDAPTQFMTLDGSVNTSPMFLLHDVSNVTIQAAATNPTSAQKPLLKAPSRTGNYVIYGQRVDGLTLKNLRIQNADKGVVIDRSNNVKVDGVEIFNTGTEGLHFRDGSDYAEVMNSAIAHTGMERADRGEGLYLCNDRKMWNSYYQPTPKEEDRRQNCDHAKIHHNTFGPNIGAEPIDIKEGTVGIRIYNNHFIMKMDDAGLLATPVLNLPKYAIHMKGTEAVVDNNTFDFTGAVSTLQAAISVDQQLDDDPALAFIHGYYNWAVNNKVTGNNTSQRVFKAASNGGATYGCNTIAGGGLVDEVPSKNTPPARRYIAVSGANCVPPAVPGGSGASSSVASSVAPSSSSSSRSSVSSSSAATSSTASGSCHTINVTTAVELNLATANCVNFTHSGGLAGKTLAVWDSDANSSCDFRGSVSTNGTGAMSISANYMAASNLTGTRATFTSTNGCSFVKVRAY
jgi:hypothetical protein